MRCKLACSRLQDSGEKSFSKKKCKKRVGLGRDASYFRFARFNTSPLYYLRAWHKLVASARVGSNSKGKKNTGFFKTKGDKIFQVAIIKTEV